MKKYTDKHLESVEPEFIPAFEETIEMLNLGISCDSVCPQSYLEWVQKQAHLLPCRDVCPKILAYPGSYCPCHKFGREAALKIAMDFVTQWKQWAGIEE